MSDTAGEWVHVGALKEFQENTIVPVELAGRSIIIVNSEGEYRCFNDECAHQPVKLSEFGELGENSVLMCHAHGACFDLRSGGAAMCPPAREGLISWPTKVDNDKLLILLNNI